ETLPGRINYFIGNDPTTWRRDVPLFSKVRVADLYAGIDLVYYGDDHGKLEHDFIVAPRADPGQIRIVAENVRAMRLESSGELVLSTFSGEARLKRPVIYQEVDGRRMPIEGMFQRIGKREIGFKIGRYDRTRTLVIDPILIFSTYLGGSQGSTIRD